MIGLSKAGFTPIHPNSKSSWVVYQTCSNSISWTTVQNLGYIYSLMAENIKGMKKIIIF
jgi:hypothetical protein